MPAYQMQQRYCRLLLLLSLLAVGGSVVGASSSNETAARMWFDQFNEDYQDAYSSTVQASWDYATNINMENAAKQLAARLNFSEFQVTKRAEMDRLFAWRNFSDATLLRLFAKAADIGMSVVTDTAKLTRFNQLVSNMSSIYSTAKVMDPENKTLIDLSPGVTDLMKNLATPEPIKKLMWQRWRDATGRKVREMYKDYVQLSNEMIKAAGYENTARYWQSWYEMDSGAEFERMMAKLWEDLRPMYAELHAYMRHKLMDHYGSHIFPPTRQIPGHILGHMWAGRWDDLEPITKPHPDEERIDITGAMNGQKWTAKKIFEVSEEFFASLGLGNMTELFWKHSVIERIPDVQMVCHASAWDFYSGKGDFRIKQCTEVNENYLAVTHHEMGHIQYYQQYEHQKVVFRRGANPGFHEAVGDVIELSVMTPGHLRKIGLLNSTSESEKFYLNYLYLMALKKVAYLPFGYLIDQWRWKVFKGEVAPENFNDEWVNQRCQLMGVSSPVLRTAEDFDPGCVYHITANVPYIRYFVSFVLQFQLHEALCKAAGITTDIHKCSIYQNAAAGAKLKSMLAKGSSQHWQDILEELSGDREIKAEPMIKYFQPLMEFIKEQNRKNNVQADWDSECPDASWYSKSAQSLRLLPLPVAAGAVLLLRLLLNKF